MAFEIGFGGQSFDPRDLLKDNESDDDATTWIVQFVGPLAPDQVKTLRAQRGLALVDFIPESTYIERIPPEKALALREHVLVRAVVAYGPDLKVSPTVDALRRDHKDDDDVATRMTATLFDDADLAGAATSVQRLGAVDVYPFDDRPRGGTAVLRFGVHDLGLLRKVARLEGVRWIEPVLEMADDSAVAAPPQPAIARFGPIWDQGVHGEGQVIGVMDAGPFDMEHCFFEDPAVHEPGPSHRKVLALRNKVGSRPGPHATFVAACAAGDEATAPGAHPRRGGAWAAKLVGSNRRDLKTESTLPSELGAAAAAGATIHSNSWHLPPPGRKRSARPTSV